MKMLIAAMGLAWASAAVATLAQDEEEEGKKPRVMQIVVPVEGVHEFVVSGRSTHFRVPVSTIAGGTIGEPKGNQ